MKGLGDLIFPETYSYYMGIVDNLDCLQSPNPYSYGIVAQPLDALGRKRLITAIEELIQTDEEFMFCDLTPGKLALRELGVKKGMLLTFPDQTFNFLPFQTELAKNIKDVKVKLETQFTSGGFGNHDQYLNALSVSLKHIFIGVMAELLTEFPAALEESTDYNAYDLSVLLLAKNEDKSEEYIRFLSQWTQTQSFFGLYDDAYYGITGNYLRYLNIFKKSNKYNVYI